MKPTTRLASLAALATLSLAVTTPAVAQPTSRPTETVFPSAAPPAEPQVAVTVSPLHMLVPMIELTAEVRLSPRVGVAVIGGLGLILDVDTNDKITLLEGGVSGRYYLTGTFRRGVQVGAEALYVHASTSPDETPIAAEGLAIGPFLGYKWTHRSGLTLEAQFGVSYLTAHAQAAGAMANDRTVLPILNLGAGWSF